MYTNQRVFNKRLGEGVIVAHNLNDGDERIYVDYDVKKNVEHEYPEVFQKKILTALDDKLKEQVEKDIAAWNANEQAKREAEYCERLAALERRQAEKTAQSDAKSKAKPKAQSGGQQKKTKDILKPLTKDEIAKLYDETDISEEMEEI